MTRFSTKFNTQTGGLHLIGCSTYIRRYSPYLKVDSARLSKENEYKGFYRDGVEIYGVCLFLTVLLYTINKKYH